MTGRSGEMWIRFMPQRLAPVDDGSRHDPGGAADARAMISSTTVVLASA
jgi:hypothetical protein